MEKHKYIFYNKNKMYSAWSFRIQRQKVRHQKYFRTLEKALEYRDNYLRELLARDPNVLVKLPNYKIK